MVKSYLKLLLIFFLFWSGCKDDNNITSSHTSNELLGEWKYIGNSLVWGSLKYLIINSDHYYYTLNSYEANTHEISEGVYSITENQINIDGMGLFIFTVHGDTLTLKQPDFSLIFVRDNTAPTKDKWLIPVTVLKEIPLSDSIRIGDITFDGTYFWTASAYFDILKIDTMGNAVLKFSIYNGSGITYDNGYLWISREDTLKKVNPANGITVSYVEINPYSVLVSLASTNGYIWARSNIQFLKIKEESGETVDSVTFLSSYAGIEFQNNKIWTTHGSRIYSVDPDNGIVIDNYQLPSNNYVARALTFDGTSFWVVLFNYETDSYVLQKLDIPL